MRRAGAAALVALMALAAPVAAQPQKDAARAHFDRARELHAKKQYLEAAEAYLAAFAEVPMPAFLYNAGQVYRLAGDHDRAVEHYRRYLELEPDGEGSADARAFLAELERDEPSPSTSPSTSPSPSTTTSTLTATSEGDGGGSSMRVTALVSLGVGVIALGAAAGFAYKASAAEGDLSEHEGEWTPAEADLYQSGEDADRYAMISLGVGAVALVAGGVFYYLGRRADARAMPQAAIAPTASGAVLVWSAGF